MSEPTTRDREIAGKIYDYVMSPPGPCPLVEIEHIATILAAERENSDKPIWQIRDRLIRILENRGPFSELQSIIELLTTLLK